MEIFRFDRRRSYWHKLVLATLHGPNVSTIMGLHTHESLCAAVAVVRNVALPLHELSHKDLYQSPAVDLLSNQVDIKNLGVYNIAGFYVSMLHSSTFQHQSSFNKRDSVKQCITDVPVFEMWTRIKTNGKSPFTLLLIVYVTSIDCIVSSSSLGDNKPFERGPSHVTSREKLVSIPHHTM
ncbi:hypothetical protein JOB18_038917 [Solea senegalensis]|uniref:Uncharacterized protein n=1 Tax=Solea senegalensis TaxID=28829 RepID=A0AAV6QS16_SOLSE|nr:hypothetical protein JOB18_038917 [Solea senegalensis]